MKQRKLKVYMHQPTGNIMRLTEKQAQKLNKEWSEVQFVKNEKGQQVMRFRFEHEKGVTATVDVLPNGEKEVSVNGKPSAS
jgi:hypothetical protein